MTTKTPEALNPLERIRELAGDLRIRADNLMTGPASNIHFGKSKGYVDASDEITEILNASDDWVCVQSSTLTKPADAERALAYVFGNIGVIDWKRVVDEGLTPPWPLEHHARAMGLLKPADAGVTSEEAYRACKVGRITRDEPSGPELAKMRDVLTKFAEGRYIASRHARHGEVVAWRYADKSGKPINKWSIITSDDDGLIPYITERAESAGGKIEYAYAPPAQPEQAKAGELELLEYAVNHSSKRISSRDVRFELAFKPMAGNFDLRDYLAAALSTTTGEGS